jgi:predicted nucleic acid-binding protein
MRYALDTNILVYAEGFDDASKQKIARRALANLPVGQVCVSINVLGELYNVLTRRGLSRPKAQAAVASWRGSFFLQATSEALLFSALDIAVQRRLKVWDALVSAAAVESGCDVLLSEDFQDGYQWQRVTVANPFAGKPRSLVADLLR